MTGLAGKRAKKRAGGASAAAKLADSEASRDAATRNVQATLAAVCAISLVVAIVALGASAVSAANSERDDMAAAEELLQWASDSLSQAGALSDRAARFAAFGSIEAYNDFFAVAGTSTLAGLTQPPLGNRLADGELRDIAAHGRGPIRSFVARTIVGMSVAALAHGSTPAATPHAAMARWSEAKVTPEVLKRYATILNSSGPLYADSLTYRQMAALANDNATSAADRTAILSQLREIGLSITSSGMSRQDLRNAIATMRNVFYKVDELIIHTADETTAEVRGLVIGCLVCAILLWAIVFATVAALLLNARSTVQSQRQSHNHVSMRATLASVMGSHPFAMVLSTGGTVLTTMAIGILIAAVAARVDTERLSKELHTFADFSAELASSTSHICEFVTSGLPHEAYMGFEHRDAATFGMAEFNDFAASSVTFGAMGGESLRSAMEAMYRAQNISSILALHAFGIAATQAGQELFYLTPAYNIESEPRYEEDRVTYRDDYPEYRYSTLANDLATNNAATLRRMAEHALFGQRAFRSVRSVTEAIPKGPAAIMRQLDLGNVADELRRLLIAAMTLTGIVGIAMCLLVVRIVLGILQTTAEVAGSKDLLGQLFAGTIRRSVAAVAFLVLIIAIQLGLTVQYRTNATEVSGVLFAAHRRGSYVAESMLAMNQFARVIVDTTAAASTYAIDPTTLANLHGVFGTAATLQQRICALEVSLGDARSLVSNTPLGETSAQVEATLGGTAPTLDRRLIDWVSRLSTICSMQLSIELAATSSTTSGGQTVTVRNYRFARDNTDVIVTAAADMKAAVRRLMAQLEASTNVYHDDATTRVTEPLIPAGVMLAILIICAILEDRLIFNPTGERLAMEESGARLLLNMIPPAVRSVVPKIRLYLETGVIVQQDAETRAHPMTCERVTRFLAEWQSGAPEAEASALLDSSIYATVIIDGLGTVQHVNKVFLDSFDYAQGDIVGENVKMLTEEPIRSLHDGFLRRYVGGGTSRLVGQTPRDVFLLTKGGSRRHVMIRLHEASRNSDVFFLGLLQPYNGAAVTEDAAMAAALAAVERD